MKSKEELAALKEEFEAIRSKLTGLTEEELTAVSGGYIVYNPETHTYEIYDDGGKVYLGRTRPDEACNLGEKLLNRK